MTRPRSPNGLGSAGRAVWRRVTESYAMEEANPYELAALEQACRTLDVCAELARQVEEEGVTVTGSQGQRRAHPALAELRLQRKLAADLLRQLGLDAADAEDAAESASPTTRRAAQAARKRWSA